LGKGGSNIKVRDFAGLDPLEDLEHPGALGVTEPGPYNTYYNKHEICAMTTTDEDSSEPLGEIPPIKI
jgi:hypothetical protein